VKISQRSGGAPSVRNRERFLLRVDVRAARLISTLMLLCVLGGLTVLVMRDHFG
jgi:hypothetical protein